MRWRALALASAALVLVSCTRDVEPSREASVVPHHVAAVIEITFRNIGLPTMTSSALVASSVAELEALHARQGRRSSFDLTVPTNTSGSGNATIEIAALSAGSVTINGSRYFQATYRARNAQKTDSAAFDTPRHNLTFVPVSTANTILDTPVLVFNRSDGTPADQLLTRQLRPTGMVAVNLSANITTVSPDVLQILSEAEVAAIAPQPDVTNIFPYGFMVRRTGSTTTRTLDASPSPVDFQGTVTFAYRLPLQANPVDDPTTVTLMMLALDDSDVRISESLEEQTPSGEQAVQQRAASLTATQIRLLPGGFVPGQPASKTRLFCSVRTAGFPGAPTATLVDAGGSFVALNPSPYTQAGSFVSPTASLQATFSTPVQGAGPNNFIVRGLQSGQAFRGATYTTNGNVVTTPAGRFSPGEEVEVVITTALSCPKPWVGRLRIKAPTRSSGTLASQAVPTAGGSPATVAIGDFTGDSILDLAVANFGENTATIMRGDGSGGFTVIGTVIVGNAPASIVTADFNGDGILDLAASNFNDNTVSVLLGNGNGTFQTAKTFGVGGKPTEILTGDLNGDGIMDLVVDDSQSGDLSVLMGNGDGTFQPQQAVPTPESSRAIALGDLNGDGILDLVTASNGDISVNALLGNGDGTFTPVNRAITTGFVNSFYVALGDLNGDGRLDAVTVTNGAQGVTVMLGNGDGTFQAPQTYDLGGLPGTSIAIGDMNGDGILDLVAVAQSGNAGSVVVLPGVGDGTFPIHNNFATSVGAPSFVAVGDLTRNGIIDVVVGNSKNGANNFAVFLGQP